MSRSDGPRDKISAEEQSTFFSVTPEKKKSAPDDKSGHRQRLRERFQNGGADAVPDYELLEMILFRAFPRIDTKPIAKRLLAKFGSFADVVLCSCRTLEGSRRRRRPCRRRAETYQSRCRALDEGRDQGPARRCRHGPACSIIYALPRVSKPASSSAFSFSTKRTSSSPTRCREKAPSITRPSMCARSSSARSSYRHRQLSSCTIIRPAIRRHRAPTST